MYLLTILLTYSLERSVDIHRHWHWRRLILRWQYSQFGQHKIGEFKTHSLGHLVWALIPALLVGFILALLDSPLLTFFISAFAMLLAILVPTARQALRSYLAAAEAGDEAAMAAQQRTLQQVSHQMQPGSVPQLLLWIHLRHYFAVFLYFVLFGITGALLYATLRDMRQPRNSHWQLLQQVIDWLPTRLMTFGFLLVGNFSTGFATWLNSIGNQPQDNFTVVTRIAAAAEPIASTESAQQSALTTVALLKRNMLFFIVLLAILTIVSWLP